MRLVLAFALRLLLANRDAEQREEVLRILWAPESGWEAVTERAMLRAASAVQGIDQVDEVDVIDGEVTDGAAGSGIPGPYRP